MREGVKMFNIYNKKSRTKFARTAVVVVAIVLVVSMIIPLFSYLL